MAGGVKACEGAQVDPLEKGLPAKGNGLPKQNAAIAPALIIGIDPETPEPVKVGEFLNYFPWDFRFQIIATGAKEPTIRDGEKLLESLERTNLAFEQRRSPNQDGQVNEGQWIDGYGQPD